MTEHDDHDEQPVVFDGVDDAVVADTDAETIATAESLHAGRSGINCQERDRPANARLILSIDALQCAHSGRSKLDLERHETRSPSEVGLDLIPRDVRALFRHGSVERGNILSFFGRIH